MSALLIVSLQPLDGKTTVIVGLAQHLHQQGHPPTLLRLHAGDPGAEGAQTDARLYSLLPFARETASLPVDLRRAVECAAAVGDGLLLLEGDAGLSVAEMSRALGSPVLLLARYGQGLAMEELRAAANELGGALVGVVVTAVPERRREEVVALMVAARLPCLGLLPEDGLLASFTVAQLQDALAAELLVDGDLEQVVERVVIGPVSADPGREYFSRFPRPAVITRSHKPDLQLAALDSGAACLVVAGGRPLLEYVTARAREEGVPVLLTAKETAEATVALEGVYGRERFQGWLKVERAGQLVSAHLDHGALQRALGPG